MNFDSMKIIDEYDFSVKFLLRRWVGFHEVRFELFEGSKSLSLFGLENSDRDHA